MQGLIGAIVAAFAGIVLGFWLRHFIAKWEQQRLERRGTEQTAELIAVRAELAQAQGESAGRAGYASLAGERAKTIEKMNIELNGLRGELQAKAETDRAQTARVSQLEAELKAERAGLAEKLALLDSAKDALSNQFQALAGKILDDKTKTFTETNKTELSTLLDPLKTQIKEFREKVEQAQSDSKTGVAKLEGLIGNLGSLNLQLAEEAKNLTTALRGSAKAQGDWGEFILRDLLEKAGLREGDQYSFQQNFTGLAAEDGEKSKSRCWPIPITPTPQPTTRERLR